MKKITQYCLATLSSLGITCLLQGCPMTKGLDYLLPSSTRGIWEWVRTTTPSQVITPQSVGYTKQLAVLTDNQGAYVAFYRNDTLQRRVNETSTDTAHTFTDEVRKTVLIKYGGAGFIKYYIASDGSSTTLTISELMNPYSFQTDTVRSVYKQINKRLYPY